MDYKVFSDAIHGTMSFHPLLVAVLDTPQVQRLRNIKQLGPCYFVFPSASHNRFEHSLGTAFIAAKLMDSLKEKGIPSDVDGKTWEKWKLCAQVAGLCHDVGHGPFSHTWERFRKRCGAKWKHELESVKIFEEILNEKISPSKRFKGLETVADVFKHYDLDKDDVELIKDMILGKKEKRNYLYQVISNKNDNIDVDKWEYIKRDSFMLNVPTGFDFHRLLNYCRVLQNSKGEKQICYREKECSLLVEMFLARGRLHDVAYQHHNAKIIEEMLIDAFELANDRLKLSETPITKLSDHIYQKILYEDFGDDKKMKKAKEILRRIENRYLYKCIAEESFQGKAPNFKKIQGQLKSVREVQPYLEDIGAVYIEVHMTKANRKKTLENLLVYQKIITREGSYEMFDWDKHQNSLKIDLKNLERNKILLLYKGTQDVPNSVLAKVSACLREILVNEASN